MASFKIWFLVLRTLFALSLIASAEVSPQNINDSTAGKGVEEGKYPGGGYGGYPGGGYGGYAGGGYGGYRGGGRGGYGGRGGRGGYCRYGCCWEYRHGGCHRSCGHTNEVPDTEFQEKPKN